MTKTLTFRFDNRCYVACVDEWTKEVKDLKRNQANEALDLDHDCWCLWFSLDNGHDLEVRFKREDFERTFDVLGAVEFDEEGIIIEDYEVKMTIK